MKRKSKKETATSAIAPMPSRWPSGLIMRKPKHTSLYDDRLGDEDLEESDDDELEDEDEFGVVEATKSEEATIGHPIDWKDGKTSKYANTDTKAAADSKPKFTGNARVIARRAGTDSGDFSGKGKADREDSRIGGGWTWELATPYDHPLNQNRGELSSEPAPGIKEGYLRSLASLREATNLGRVATTDTRLAGASFEGNHFLKTKAANDAIKNEKKFNKDAIKLIDGLQYVDKSKRAGVEQAELISSRSKGLDFGVDTEEGAYKKLLTKLGKVKNTGIGEATRSRSISDADRVGTPFPNSAPLNLVTPRFGGAPFEPLHFSKNDHSDAKKSAKTFTKDVIKAVKGTQYADKSKTADVEQDALISSKPKPIDFDLDTEDGAYKKLLAKLGKIKNTK